MQQTNTSSSFNKSVTPVLSMLSFITSIVCRKVSTWVLLGIFSLAVFLISMLPKFLEGTIDPWYGNPIQSYIEYVNLSVMINAIVISLSSGIQGILRGLNIFKDTQKEGVEILILSKPISRGQILIARFTFLIIFAVALSLINLILVTIGAAINDMRFYQDKLAAFGGAFGASFFSFIVMAVIAISIALKCSGKVASILPISILTISAGAAVVMSSISPAIPGPVEFLNEKIQKQINDNLLNQPFLDYTPPQPPLPPEGEIPPYPPYASDNKKTAPTVSKIEHQGYSPFVYLRRTYGNNKYVVLPSQNWRFNMILSNGDRLYVSDSSYRDYPNTYQTVINTIENCYKQDQTIGASGLTTLNYLNPISAFSSMAGSTDFLNNLYGGYNDGIKIGYNNSLELKTSTSSWGITTATANQQDPGWALFLLWTSIAVGLSLLIIFSYMRKDFK